MGPKETHYIAPLRPLWKPKDNPKNPGPRHPKSHGHWTNQAWAQKNPITLPPRPSIFGMEQINTRKIVFFVRSPKCYKIFLTDKNLWPLDFCHEYFIRKWHAPNLQIIKRKRHFCYWLWWILTNTHKSNDLNLHGSLFAQTREIVWTTEISLYEPRKSFWNMEISL